MAFAGLIALVLYFAQQAGIVLGVAAEAYWLFSHGASHEKSRYVVRTALWLIVISGVLITAAHIIAGEASTVAEPAYIFKWLLVGLIIGFSFLSGRTKEILAGGSWFALLALHLLAPQATWFELIASYGAWMALFALIWLAMHRAARPPLAVQNPPEPVITIERPAAPVIAQKMTPVEKAPPVSRQAPPSALRPLQNTPVSFPIPAVPKPLAPLAPPTPPKPPAPVVAAQPYKHTSVSAAQPAPVPSPAPAAPLPASRPPATAPAPANLPGAEPIALATGAGLKSLRVMPQNEAELHKH